MTVLPRAARRCAAVCPAHAKCCLLQPRHAHAQNSAAGVARCRRSGCKRVAQLWTFAGTPARTITWIFYEQERDIRPRLRERHDCDC